MPSGNWCEGATTASLAFGARRSAASTEKPWLSIGTGTAFVPALAIASRVPMKPGSSIHASSPAARTRRANRDRLWRMPEVTTMQAPSQEKPRAMPR